ncbi:hypothetical protein GGS20DRAFT_516693 [Poronia punctata]|nr:hypothetical protein GGS20DRAFT_516693 [Poronia punctata]
MTFDQVGSTACDSLATPGLIAAPYSKTAIQDEANYDKTHYVSFPILPPLGKPARRNAVLEQQCPPVGERTKGQTKSTTLYAAWALTVSHMTKSKRVVFGVTDWQHQHQPAKLGDAAGAELLAMPIFIDSDGHQSVQDYLAHVQSQLNRFASSDLEGVREPGSDTQSRPAFSALLNIQPGKGTWMESSPCQGTSEQQPCWSTGMALTLTIHFGIDHTDITASFDSTVISDWTMRHLCRQLAFALHQLQVSSAEESISTITIATPDELEHIWNWNCAVPTPVERCVHHVIQECAASQPAAPAVCAWDGELSYGQLDRLAMGLSGQLSGLGVCRGKIVPLCFEKSMWAVVAMLGVLQTGAAFVLFDPSLPESRLLALARQVKADVIVSGDLERQLSSRLAPHVMVLGTFVSQSLYDQPASPASSSRPSDVMYIAFTSGSTGVPKGAVITHRNLASALHYQQDALRRTSRSRTYDFCAYTFDVSICNIFSTLAAGGCVCIPSEEQRRNHLVESIASLRANTIDLTPSIARILSPEQVPSIETIIFGGETLHPKDVARWWGKVNIVNLYGPCECTPNSTINSSPTSIEDAIHLGKGLGLLTWIVDADNHDVLLPSGCIGELLLEGPLVGHGYLDDPAKTAAAFIENPVWLLEGSPHHAGRPGRLYKTGDLVRLDKDGSLTFIGRKDSQVKVRGQRVELGEVEHALLACDSVDDAVVVFQHDDKQGARMVAFVTIHDQTPAFEKRPPSPEEAETSPLLG